MANMAHRWNIPVNRHISSREQMYVPVPESGRARCLEHNGYGFEVGNIYSFRTVSRADRYPPYDLVFVEKDDYSKDDGFSTMAFLNDHMDPFRRFFEIV